MTIQNNFVRLCAVIFALLIAAPFAFAQDAEPVVVDEVIAQVNDGVITLSRVRREMKTAVQSLVQQQQKTPEDAQRELEAKRPELIASLINEELILQQGKEFNLESDVEAEVNQRFDEIRKEQKFKTFDELYKTMREQGLDPDEIKAGMRKEFVKSYVFRYGVDGKIYNSLTEKELRDYFQKNPQKFKKAESITLSEVFLNFAGRNEADVRKQAAEVVAKARQPKTDFTTLVAQYSEHDASKANKGKVGTFEVEGLTDLINKAVKGLKTNGVTEPIRTDEGLMILHVDERTADAATPVYDENKVRTAITFERSPEARKKYLATLRAEAYIKIAPTYKTAVSQILDKGDVGN